ncbi:mediator of RNA polymerase II transcription subunit 1-like isoform X2 [Cynoglossus semilaevis]|uniref:mediator of RNA polymerase II transcription subunit 1-like isoform X2 n=1 Tax=Cynoglossus semilaevis TaxID=244447 RepID=UPI0007DC8FA6|nr:mediator of RNA polymerase II transcription subunit 1-like isoform X2 [Cynoglossus semilaevis]
MLTNLTYGSEMKDNIIPYLRLKFAEKTWNDTFQHVRKCMERSRDESTPCEPLVRSLERLQEEFTVPSINTTLSRLEIMAKQQGIGFHVTESTCYLTADLFYLEVVLEACGGVKEVKLAPQGAPPTISEPLLQLLRFKNFAGFSRKLAGLCAQYNIPGDNDIKLKLLKSLQYLRKDLEQISHLSRPPTDCEPTKDLINKGRVGLVIAGKEDRPLTIQFFITSPDDDAKTHDEKPVIQEAQVTVWASAVCHQLQMSSVIPQPPQLDPQGSPVSLPLDQVQHEALPACFLLRLQPPVVMKASFVKKLSLITDVSVPEDDLQWAPLPSLLARGSLSEDGHKETLERDIVCTSFPGDLRHRYVLPGAAWDSPAQTAAAVDGVPFTHPAHIPALLELLRHQCVINTLLRSCISSNRTAAVGDLHFEVLPESDTSFSVTFNPPEADSLAVLLVHVSGSHQISCSLFGAGTGDVNLDQYVTTILTENLSIPVTLRTLYTRLRELTAAPLSLSHSANTQSENQPPAPSTPPVMDTNSSTVPLPQTAAVTDDSSAVGGSACFTMSVASAELLPENKTSPVSVCVMVNSELT